MLSHLPSTVSVEAVALWLVVLTVKHLVADFLLQNEWMANGKDARTGWALPLLTHCAIHGALTTLLVAFLQPRLWYLGLVDFAIHLAIDRSKGMIVSTWRIGPQHRFFWWTIGVDQALHQITNCALALVLATTR
jgi:hypothetical protein